MSDDFKIEAPAMSNEAILMWKVLPESDTTGHWVTGRGDGMPDYKYNRIKFEDLRKTPGEIIMLLGDNFVNGGTVDGDETNHFYLIFQINHTAYYMKKEVK